jgi:hypothetical protein
MSLCNKNWFFVTKYRRDGFTKEILDDLRPIFISVCTDLEPESITKASVRILGAALCSRQATLHEAAVVRQFPLFASILSNGKR